MTEKNRTAQTARGAIDIVVELRDPSHKLWIWMQDNKVNDEALGKRLISEKRPNGVAKRTVFRWLTEGRIPELDIAQQIYNETDGYVGLMDWQTPYVKARKAALKKAGKLKTRAK